MTTQSNNPVNNVVDELTGNWFDSESCDIGYMESSGDIHNSLTEDQIKRSVELRLVHSLLLHVADRDEAARERRVQKVMQKVESDNKVLGIFNRIARPLVRYGVAAVIVISLAILFTKLPSNTAIAAIDQMITAIDHAGDRTYSFIIKENQRKDRREQTNRPYERRRESGERAGLDGATLYLRGNDRFVLYRRTPSGKTLINGNDGQTRWLIRPDRPVLVSNDLEAFRIPMPSELVAILSLDFKTTLLHIRDHYEVKYLEDLTDEQQQNSNQKFLDARKISRDFPGPQNIEIWSETQTGLLLRIEFANIHLQGDPSPQRLIIELAENRELSDDWFTRQAHHPQDAEVDFISQ